MRNTQDTIFTILVVLAFFLVFNSKDSSTFTIVIFAISLKNADQFLWTGKCVTVHKKIFEYQMIKHKENCIFSLWLNNKTLTFSLFFKYGIYFNVDQSVLTHTLQMNFNKNKILKTRLQLKRYKGILVCLHLWTAGMNDLFRLQSDSLS